MKFIHIYIVREKVKEKENNVSKNSKIGFNII